MSAIGNKMVDIPSPPKKQTKKAKYEVKPKNDYGKGINTTWNRHIKVPKGTEVYSLNYTTGQMKYDQKSVFAKKTRLQQAEHDLVIANMMIDKLSVHIGYLAFIAVFCVLLSIVAVVSSIIW